MGQEEGEEGQAGKHDRLRPLQGVFVVVFNVCSMCVRVCFVHLAHVP